LDFGNSYTEVGITQMPHMPDAGGFSVMEGAAVVAAAEAAS
jgi:hypothetical protein